MPFIEQLTHSPSQLHSFTLSKNLLRIQQQYAEQGREIYFFVARTLGDRFWGEGLACINISIDPNIYVMNHTVRISETVGVNTIRIILARSNVAWELILQAVDLYMNPTLLLSLLSREEIQAGIVATRNQWIDDLEYTINEREQIIQDNYAKLVVLKQGIGTWTNRLLEDHHEAILRLPEVSQISYQNERFMKVVLGTPTRIPLGGGLYVELGPYTITVDFNHSRLDRVRINTLGPSIEGFDHPHIQGGIVCWGTIQPQISAALYKLDLKNFFQLCIIFLEQYNPDDCYLVLAKWIGRLEEDNYDEDEEPEGEYYAP